MRGLSAGLLLWLLLAVSGRSYAELAYLDDLPRLPAAHVVVVDTRAKAKCSVASLAGARCLPPEEFFGPGGQLASFRDIAWVFGTAGIRGDETVIVTGELPGRRDQVAALLHLAGQAEVRVLTRPLRELLADSSRPRGPGRLRGMVRDPVFVARAREEQWLWRDEVATLLGKPDMPRILDGRPAPAYRGDWIRARRGGHLPGATSAPIRTLRRIDSERPPVPADGGPVIAYAQGPADGLAYLTVLRAGFGLDARLYGGGWRDWAADARLPADAASHLQRDRDGVAAAWDGGVAWRTTLIALAVLSAAGFGYLLGRRT